MDKNKDELIVWFWEKFNSCYLVKHDHYSESLFMFYDPQYIRKLKLANISGKKINKTNITGVCLFEQDWINKKFYCNYYEIWNYLYLNYSIKYNEIQQFISDRLEEHTKLSVLTPCPLNVKLEFVLEEHTKLSVLTPDSLGTKKELMLEEHTKLSVLTPSPDSLAVQQLLEEHSKKLSVLTPENCGGNVSSMLGDHDLNGF